ncbi:hypothetical protein CoNPh27_CDS0103 [Staphylococcus phage S-CoN_Ph27]|nr:hypothetical protein CoNPh27_CDS0103 [Staphylococcus phage S-CoN_Ph27]
MVCCIKTLIVNIIFNASLIINFSIILCNVK